MSVSHLFLLRRVYGLPPDWCGVRFEVWQHVDTGEAFAVSLHGEEIRGAVPVDLDTVEFLDSFPYSTPAARDRARILEPRREEFRPWATWIPGAQDAESPEERRQKGREAAQIRWRREREVRAA